MRLPCTTTILRSSNFRTHPVRSSYEYPLFTSHTAIYVHPASCLTSEAHTTATLAEHSLNTRASHTSTRPFPASLACGVTISIFYVVHVIESCITLLACRASQPSRFTQATMPSTQTHCKTSKMLDNNNLDHYTYDVFTRLLSYMMGEAQMKHGYHNNMGGRYLRHEQENKVVNVTTLRSQYLRSRLHSFSFLFLDATDPGKGSSVGVDLSSNA